MKTMETKTYRQLKNFSTFLERYNYAKLSSKPGVGTFGYDRYLNQMFYTSTRWRSARNAVIVRDEGLDLGFPGHEIAGKILVHHLNVVTLEDLENDSSVLYDPDFLVCVSQNTHLAIHFSDESLLPADLIERKPGDTYFWTSIKGQEVRMNRDTKNQRFQNNYKPAQYREDSHIAEDKKKPSLVRVIADSLNLRFEPNGKILMVLESDTKLEVLSEEGEWLKVRVLETNNEGFVKKSFTAE